MLKSIDLIHLPCTPDLTEGGIAYACRSLASTVERTSGSLMERLRLNVAEAAVELALRRYLSKQSIPFCVMEAAPFAHPERYDISLGGHRCSLKSFLITSRKQISQLRKDPALLLQAPALLPLDEFAVEDHKADDLYIFAFLLGIAAAAREDEQRAKAAGQPVHLIHPLPAQWKRPANWLPLENLVLKSECAEPIAIEIGGQNAEREFVTARLELPPKKRMYVEQQFHSLSYVHATPRPEARIGLHSPVHGDPYIVPPHEWSNIWVYGMDIIMTGWLTHEDYRRKGKVLNIGMHTLQSEHTREKNLLVPMGELNPLRPLFERVQAWAGSQRMANQKIVN